MIRLYHFILVIVFWAIDCELFGISTEELLRDKKIEEKKEEKHEKKVDIVKAVLICIAIFFYFLAVISTIVLEEVVHLNDGLVASSFLMLSAIGTIILIFTFLTRRSKKESRVEKIEEEKKNPMLRPVISIFSLVTTCVYLLVSFITMAWHITWIIWIVYAIGVEVIKLIFSLKGVNSNEE